MKKKNNKNLIKKLIIAGVAFVVLVAVGYFGFRFYQDYQANKVYSVGETVGLSDFKVDITKAEFKPVDLPLDEDVVAKYGGIDKYEDCDIQSKEATWKRLYYEGYDFPWEQNGPSDFNICIRRNNSRDEINDYLKSNSQLVVDYKITAINNVDTSKLKIELIPDSGRKLGEQVNSFNANQFFPGGEQRKIDVAGAPGLTYTPSLYYDKGEYHNFTESYEPYYASDLGNDINKGLTRSGNIYTDIRKSESSVDVKITYKNDTRIVRVTRQKS